MNPHRLLPPVVVAALGLSVAGAAPERPERVEVPIAAPVASGVRFEPNLGQCADGVLGLARCGRQVVAIDSDGLTAVSAEGAVLRLDIDGLDRSTAEFEGRLPGLSHYLKGQDRSRWVRHVPSFGGLLLDGDAVDVAFQSQGTALRFDFELTRAADAGRLALTVPSGTTASSGADGALELRNSRGRWSLSAPVAYQPDGVHERPVACEYVIDGSRVTFRLTGADADRPLVIDPTLEFSSFLGGDDRERAEESSTRAQVDVDDDGDIYVLGTSRSTDFPTTGGAYQEDLDTTDDFVVTKIDGEDGSIVWATYVGGDEGEAALGFVVHGEDEQATLCGSTVSSDYPLENEAASTGSGVLTRLSADGSSLDFSTRVGAVLRGIALRSDDKYVELQAGTISAFTVVQRSADGQTVSNPRALSLPSGFLIPTAIAIADDDDAVICGWITNTGLPTTASSLQQNPSGGHDGFVVRVTDQGALDWATYLGGRTTDNAFSVDILANGRICVAGRTASNDFPTTTDAHDRSYAGDSQFDGFLAVLESDGTALDYSTYLGGAGTDQALGVAAGADAIHVAGWTTSTAYPVEDAYQSTNGGGRDAFLTVFGCDYEIDFSTYFGGTGDTEGRDVAVTPDGDSIVVSKTTDATHPVFLAAQAFHAGTSSEDLAFLRFSGLATALSAEAPLLPDWTVGRAVDELLTAEGARGEATWTLLAGTLPPGVTLSTSGALTGTPTTTDTFEFTARVTDECERTVDLELTWVVNPAPSLAPVAAIEWTVGVEHTTLLQPSGGTPPLTIGIASGVLPPGMSLDGQGEFTGTPTTAGAFVAHVEIEDLRGATVTTSLAMTVNEAPSVDDPGTLEWTADVEFIETLAVSGGTGPFFWDLASGSLPPGLDISPNGIVSGTPTAAGESAFEVRVTDDRGAQATRPLSMTVNAFPAITTPAFPECTEGRPYEHALTSTGGTAPLVWSVVDGQLPVEQSLGADAVAGTARSAGTYDFTLVLTDAAGAVVQRAYAATMNAHPSIATAELPFGAVDRPMRVSLAHVEGTGVGTWTADVLPDGLALSSSGLIDGHPTAPSSRDVVFRYTDTCGAEVERTLAVVVAPRFGLDQRKNRADLVFDGSAQRFHLELLAGTSLNVSLKRLGKGTLPVRVTLLRADRSPIPETGRVKAKKRAFSWRGLTVPETGHYVLVIEPTEPFDGAARLSVQAKAPKGVVGTRALAANAEGEQIEVEVLPGSTTTWVLSAVKRSDARPDLTTIVDSETLLIGVGGAKATKKGSKAPRVFSGTGGRLVATYGNRAPASGIIQFKVKVKAPKAYSLELRNLTIGSPPE